jgi:hypothetical protein
MNKKLKVSIEDPASIFGVTNEVFTEAKQFLAGMTEKVPEEFRPSFASIRKKVDDVLAGLAAQPTTQVPAAQEASYALQHLAYALSSMKELYDGAMETLNGLIKDYAPKVQELSALNGRIEKGELLGDERLGKRIEEAVTKARDEERTRADLLGKRRSVLAKANLPVPPSDAALEGDEKTFDGVKNTAENRIKTLNEEGFCTQLNTEQLADLAYGAEKTYTTMLNMARSVKANRGPTATPEPLAGGKAGVTLDEDRGARPLMFA